MALLETAFRQHEAQRAVIKLAWGNAPGLIAKTLGSAESANSNRLAERVEAALSGLNINWHPIPRALPWANLAPARWASKSPLLETPKARADLKREVMKVLLGRRDVASLEAAEFGRVLRAKEWIL